MNEHLPTPVRDAQSAAQTSFAARLQRNQAGIMIAIVLTLAAGALLAVHFAR